MCHLSFETDQQPQRSVFNLQYIYKPVSGLDVLPVHLPLPRIHFSDKVLLFRLNVSPIKGISKLENGFLYHKIELPKSWEELSELEQASYLMQGMRELVVHELEEVFTYKGFRWFDPHFKDD